MSFFRKIVNKILHKEKPSLKHVGGLFSFIFVLWAIYRYFPEILPAWAEELILKPIVWLLPTFWMVTRIEKKSLSSLGLSSVNLFPSFYWGIGLGLVFALEGLLTNILKYGGLTPSPVEYSLWAFALAIFLSFATAFSEEIVFRGYIFSRLRLIWSSEWLANLVSAFLFVIIHLPVGVFVLGYTPLVMLVYLFLVFVFGLGSGFVFARTGNIVSSILLHVLWSWPIILFK